MPARLRRCLLPLLMILAVTCSSCTAGSGDSSFKSSQAATTGVASGLTAESDEATNASATTGRGSVTLGAATAVTGSTAGPVSASSAEPVATVGTEIQKDTSPDTSTTLGGGSPVSDCPDPIQTSVALGIDVSPVDVSADVQDDWELVCQYQSTAPQEEQTLGITLTVLQADDPMWVQALETLKEAAAKCATGCDGKTESEDIEFDAYMELPDGYEAVDVNFLELNGRSAYLGGIGVNVKNGDYLCASLPLTSISSGFRPEEIRKAADGIVDLLRGMCGAEVDAVPGRADVDRAPGALLGADGYGSLKIGMTEGEARSAEPSLGTALTPSAGGCTSTSSGLGSVYFDSNGRITVIDPSSDEVTTPEGLAAGDPLTKVLELYGPEPLYQDGRFLVPAANSTTDARYAIQGKLAQNDPGEMPAFEGPQSLGDNTVTGITVVGGSYCFN